MHEYVRLLVELQTTDLEIAELRAQAESMPHRLEYYEKELAYYEQRTTELQIEMEKIAKEERAQERKLQTIQEELKKHENKIYEVKTVKELEALQAEIKKLGVEKGEVEENLLNLMQRLEEVRDKLSKDKEGLKNLREEFRVVAAQCREELAQIEDKVTVRIIVREQIIKALPPDLVELYEKIRDNRSNLAVVPVINGVCQGCYTHVPPQIINELRAGERIIRCDRCVRILYFQEA